MPTHEHRLVRAFVELADTLVADFDVAEVLYSLVEKVLDMFEVAAVGLMMSDEDGNLNMLAYSGEHARLIELLEMQRREGPCYEAFTTGRYVFVEDPADEVNRWPIIMKEAIDAGYTAVHAVPMRLRNEVIGAMNLFEGGDHRLTEQDIAVIQGLTDVATIAVLQARAVNEARETADQLQVALRVRVILEQAKGMIAQGAGIAPEQAFSILRRYARGRRMRLAEAARQVVEGQLSVSEIAASDEPVAGMGADTT
ncbi:MAG TPA: GAF and ANTAR domain-containing protein [Acidimicrobiia bacterium]|nr:GAF and ANTAR domain-containing protein [Acidimicrobiia bacterium]